MYKFEFKSDFIVNQETLNEVMDSIVHNTATRDIHGLRELVITSHLENYAMTFAQIICYIIKEKSKEYPEYFSRANANVKITGSRVIIALNLQSDHTNLCCYDFIKKSIIAANCMMAFLILDHDDSHL